MKRFLLNLWFLLPVMLYGQSVIQVTSNITSDTRWTADHVYELTGTNFIYVVNNATLTIEPGTLIKGNPAALVITRGSKINAVGLAEKPIVFTSAKPAGQRAPGDWGGLLLLGKALVNCPGGECTVEGGLDPNFAKYGGTDDADQSGVLKYVRIEFAGIAFQPNNETNGLTLAGVGSLTEISYVQVSHGGDDGIEWFGGSVNGKYLVVNKTVDDMFDTDFGFRGLNQFVVGISDPALADISGSNGFEADNDAQGTLNTPISQAVFSNVTIIGPKFDSASTINANYRRGFHLRRSTRQSIRNSIITGFPSAARLESGNSEQSYLQSKELKIQNNIFAGYTKFLDSTSVNSLTIQDSLLKSNRTFASLNLVRLKNPTAGSPDLLPATGSPALSGSNFDSLSSFMTRTTYVGAFGTTDWTKCWCEWDANAADYSKGLDYLAGISDFSYTVQKNEVKYQADGGAGAQYQWEFGDFTGSTEQNPSHLYGALGTYVVKLTVTTAKGCVKAITKNITISEGASEIAVTTDITTDTKWTSDKIYNLTGAPFIYVRNNATLTIEAGTLIKGSPAALVITRGSKIIAVGTAQQPIVFTSAKPAGSRAPGDWGGLLLLGKARVNCPGGECTVEGGLDPVYAKYGGTDDNDNSGVLQYVRIEFAGIAFQPNNETNSLTLGGVGSQTIIEHVQTSFGGDDAFEWFGGTVNGKYLLAYKTVDDMFDTDFGYRGLNQFVYGISDPNLADISGSNGFEADNDAQGTVNTPVSQSVFSNVTILGPRQDAGSTFNTNFRRGMHLRRSTKQSVVNSIIAGFPTGVRLESANCENFFLTTKELELRNNIFSSSGKLFDSTSVNTKAVSDLFVTQNRTYGFTTELGLSNPYGNRPAALPAPGSPALSGSSFTSMSGFFDRTNYVGAFGDTDWTDCWASYDPNTEDYSFAPIHYFKEDIDFTNSGTNGQISFVPNIQGNYSYHWNFGDQSPISTEASPVHNYQRSGPFTVILEITNARGCVKQISKAVQVIVATNDLEEVGHINVYPNPNHGEFEIGITSLHAGSGQLQLVNAMGSVLLDRPIQLVSGEQTLSVKADNSVCAGYYTVRIVTAKGILSRAIIVH